MKKLVLALLLFTFLLNSKAQICHTLTVNSTSVLCNGNATGSATVSVLGGVPPYTYTWSPSGGNTIIASGLIAGVYSITVADAGTCTVTRTVNIAQPNLLFANPTQTNIICYDGVNFGTASVQTIGGTAPMSYTWNPFGGNSSVQGGLLSGTTYTCIVRDANNCTTTATVAITGPQFSLTATTTQTNNLCGTANGRGSVAAAGGTPPYTYTWSPSGGNLATSTTLTAGVYTVFVRDFNNCATSRTINILQSSQFTISPNVTNVTCNGAVNGSASVTLSGGTPAFTYTWSPTGGNATTASGLGAGIYTLSARDSYSCIGSVTVNIAQPAPLTSTATQVNILCNAGTGTANIAVSGGNTVYAYAWIPSGGTGPSATLTVGNYTVTVTDASLCVTTKTYNFSQPPALLVSLTQTNIICSGIASGAGSVSATGGTGAYTYTWSPSGGNNPLASNLAAGNYTIVVRDANNCINSQTVGITSTPPINGSVNSSPANCNNPDGSATVTASGGTGALTYSWIPTGGSATVATAINAGQYTCTVKDANNCTLNLPTTVAVINPSISLSASSVSICPGSSATLSASGGVSYSWTPTFSLSSTTGSVVIASPSVSTVYSVTGASIFGCTVTETLSLILLAYPSLSISLNAPDLCSGAVANFVAQGAINYTWNPATGLNSAFVASPTTTLSTPIIYTVTGSNAIGCEGTQTINVAPLATPVLTLANSSSTAACSSETITLSATGASSYSWNVSTSSADSIHVSFPTSTLVVVSGTATNGCSNTATLQVNIISVPVVAIQGSTIVCKAATTILTATGAATYSWSNGTSGSSTPVTPTTNTTYTVRGFDPSGCSSTATTQLFIYITPTVTILGNSEVCKGDKLTLTASGGATYTWSTGEKSTTVSYVLNSNTVISVSSNTGNCEPGTGSITVKVNQVPTLVMPVTSGQIFKGQSFQIEASSSATKYSWLPSESLDCPKCSNPIAKPLVSTVYTVEASNESGCKRIGTISIDVDDSCTDPYTPTAFSPDDDGNNDTWCIYSSCVTALTGDIYNRWGQKVFTITDLNQCWDGKLNGVMQSPGVFIFQANATLINGETKLLKGNFTLVK